MTEKLDGGNCCLCAGKVFARTHKHEATHDSFSPVKALYARVIAEMTETEVEELSLFGENMTGVHSIDYPGLTSCFYLFGAFRKPQQGAGHWLSWDAVARLARRLCIPHVAVVYRGVFESAGAIHQLMLKHAQLPSSVSSQQVRMRSPLSSIFVPFF